MTQLPDLSDTIVAVATPPGAGAIAVIRLSGTDAITIADAIFHGKRLSESPSHRAHFGSVVDENGATLDEVLATVFHSPRSYTGENVVEIGCHGSTYIQQRIVSLCLRHGARAARPGEFTLRAFLHGKLDLSQAEAVADLIAGETEAAHTVALQQLRGGVKDEIARLREELIHFASLIELELDFSEEDVEFADRTQLKDLVARIRAAIGRLLQSFTLGNAIKTGVTTVIAGRPNAGKSTLLNALLNEERAIVSEIAGTTRDTIEESLNINGVQFRLVDTAGIREAQDQIEAIGVQRTFEKIGQAAIVVYVWDVAGLRLDEALDDIRSLRDRQHDGAILVACNKMDRNPHFKPDWLIDPSAADIHPYLLDPGTPPTPVGLTQDQIVTISALNRQNIQYLQDKLFELAVGEDFRRDQTIVSNIRHYEALRLADAALADVAQGLAGGVAGDFVAMDIRRALNFLGEISGAIGVEDLLGNIFGKFCIGK